MKANQTPLCPLCNKRASSAFAPFCSSRCAYVDLDHWFKATYFIASEEEEEHQET